MTRSGFILRTDADHAVGMGHLSRCLSLASGLEARGHAVRFAVRRADASALARLEPYEVIRIPQGAGWKEELGLLAAVRDRDCLVMDLSHTDSFARIEGFSEHTRQLADFFKGVVLIDGLRDNALAECVDVHAGMVVAPYVGADANRIRAGRARCLCGPRYMIFDPGYARVPERRDVPERARRILVTAGGSDPQGLSLAALDACREAAGDLLVRLVVGGGFDAGLRQALEDRARNFEGCALVRSPSSLVDDMLWADLAVSASGLTKYELALCGTPAILLSTCREFAEVNRPFAAAGTSLDLGVFSDLAPGRLAAALLELIADRDGRMAMARAGQRLVDPNGTNRVIDAMEALIGA